jgi:hypothetical protein
LAVANFIRGHDWLRANDGTSRTCGETRRTHAGYTGIARNAAAGITFVNRCVAIVVEPIANVGARVVVAIARNHAVRARRRTSCTNTILTRIARNAATRVVIVHDAVAIVVEAVARFSRRIVVAIARNRAVRARCRARSANAALAGIARNAATGVAVVHGAIAIVIEAVARFSRGVDVAVADDCAARARRRSIRANTLLTRGARRPAARIAIVHDAVAIVVEAIARFG